MARGIDAMVEEQIRRWHLRQREHTEEEKTVPPPLVVVSREFGSEGAAIGKAAAKVLEFSFWDQAIVHAVAERSGAPERMVESLDEHARSALEDLITAAMTGDRSTEFHYLAQVRRVVHTLELHGAAVVIGRGSQFIVKPELALRVRVVAPLDYRIDSYARRKELSADEARKKIAEVERDRRSFIRQSYKADVTDVHHYDLVLNRAGFEIDRAADVVVSAYRAKFEPGR